jgi:hypothetical protein
MDPYIVREIPPTRPRSAQTDSPAAARARALWPRLERSSIARCGGDVRCIAAQVSRRTSLPQDAILRLLTGTDE